MDFTVNTWGEVVAVLTVVGLMLAALDWRIRETVKSQVRDATRPIQPGYRNHGESLADVAHLVRKIADKVGLDEGE